MTLQERPLVVGLKRNHELVFLSLLLTLFVFLVVETISYDPAPRLVPLLTLSVLVILTILGILRHLMNEYDIELLNKTIGGGIDLIEASDLLNLDSEEIELRVTDDDDTSLASFERATAWVFIFVIGFYLFGMMNVIPLILFLFLWIESDVSLALNIGITLLTVVLVYLMFIVFLDILLFPGLIPQILIN